MLATERESGFEGRTVPVIGATAGIGRATVEHLATEGAYGILTDVDSEGGEETTIDLLEDERGGSEFRERDVTAPRRSPTRSAI